MDFAQLPSVDSHKTDRCIHGECEICRWELGRDLNVLGVVRNRIYWKNRNVRTVDPEGSASMYSYIFCVDAETEIGRRGFKSVGIIRVSTSKTKIIRLSKFMIFSSILKA